MCLCCLHVLDSAFFGHGLSLSVTSRSPPITSRCLNNSIWTPGYRMIAAIVSVAAIANLLTGSKTPRHSIQCCLLCVSLFTHVEEYRSAENIHMREHARRSGLHTVPRHFKPYLNCIVNSLLPDRILEAPPLTSTNSEHGASSSQCSFRL